MATLIADLRFAGRLFRRAPAFSVSVIAVLALGIGANAAVFSAVDRVLIRPLPFGRPQRLAMLWEDFSAFGMPKNRVSPATFFDWRRRTRTFADLAAWRVTEVNVTESAAPERVLGAATTANLLPLLGVRPMLGRTMTVDEEGPGHSVVVLSYGLWQRRLAGDPAIVGRAIRMSGERFTVIGVMPRGFHFPDAGTEFWVPIAFRAQQLTGRNSHYLRVIGRLRDDVSWASVREDMTTIARVRAIPGVAAVGLTSDVPFTSRGNYMSLRVEHQERRGGLGQDGLFRLVSAGYLETIGARLRAGRFLDERDGGDATPVVVINATLANQYWPGENALGYRIDTGTGDGAPLWMTIVGIVEDIKERGFDLGPKPAVYVPFTQTTIAFFIPSELAVRTLVPPRNLAAAVLRAVWTVDPEQPVSRIRTLEEIVESELGDRHQTLTLLGALAGLALALSAMGIYGVVSYLVSERRREIGVRLAIGATPGSIVIAMLGQGAVLTVLGIGIGALAAFPTTRLLGSLLFEVSPVDATVLGSVAALLATVTMAASYIPARRASAIDPMLVLRSE